MLPPIAYSRPSVVKLDFRININQSINQAINHIHKMPVSPTRRNGLTMLALTSMGL